jgi:hypothetical protein
MATCTNKMWLSLTISARDLGPEIVGERKSKNEWITEIYRELSNVTYNAHKSNWNVAYSQLLTSLLYISKFVEYTHTRGWIRPWKVSSFFCCLCLKRRRHRMWSHRLDDSAAPCYWTKREMALLSCYIYNMEIVQLLVPSSHIVDNLIIMWPWHGRYLSECPPMWYLRI